MSEGSEKRALENSMRTKVRMKGERVQGKPSLSLPEGELTSQFLTPKTVADLLTYLGKHPESMAGEGH